VLKQSNVGPDHITNVEQVAHRFQVSGRDPVRAGCAGSAEPLEERGDDV
jgi:hypothetical protein